MIQPHVNAPVQERTCREHDGARRKPQTDLRHHPGNRIALDQQVVHRLLEYG